MHFLLQEMQQCNSVKVCIELALSDAYGEYEQTAAWLACIDEMFGRFDRIRLLGEEVALQGFDLENELTVVAICRILNRIAPAQAGVDGKEHHPRQTCGQLRKEPVLLVPGDRVGWSRRFGQHCDQRRHPLEPRASVIVAVRARGTIEDRTCHFQTAIDGRRGDAGRDSIGDKALECAVMDSAYFEGPDIGSEQSNVPSREVYRSPISRLRKMACPDSQGSG